MLIMNQIKQKKYLQHYHMLLMLEFTSLHGMFIKNFYNFIYSVYTFSSHFCATI